MDFEKALDDRFEYIKKCQQLDFNEAQKLYVEFKNTNNNEKRKRLIEGTLCL